MSSVSSPPGPAEPEAIAIGCDHAGYGLKREILQLLHGLKAPYVDLGCASPDESVHYPLYAKKVVDAVLARPHARGILICGTGIGMSIMANRFPGIRAALCHDIFSAIMSRRHNDANLLVMGGRVIGPDLGKEIVRVWLATPFDGGRHQERLDLLERLAQKA
ncbi:MAG: ribose 5-phosphate isomerase B [Deltaproteobacteria bacterium CG07_land_8_20_14_0_80_60_11]|nr:MAG: ribose 5-phosphate isomerase B [Deltaproteobacteria bacterium CG07_land_8_20_14_0_80_60_11]